MTTLTTKITPFLQISKLIAGPLAGYTCAPMRRLIWRYQEPAFCYTEMISAKHLLTVKRLQTRYTYRAPEEKRLCWQLSGHDPIVLHEASAKAVSMGADLIDLNCGCPKGKIRAKQCGSFHVENPDRLLRLVEAMRSAVACPLIIKIRLHPSKDPLKTDEIVQAVNAGGADALVVHGRIFSDDYDIPVDVQAMARCVALSKIPVIINGDIEDTASAKRLLEQTKASGLMIGRAMTGKPWLFEQIQTEWDGGIYHPPSYRERAGLLLEHVTHLIALENEQRALLQSRKLLKYYSKGLLTERDLLEAFHIDNFASFEQWVRAHLI
jgi:tRNA-dihydrouridine synthase B